MKRLKRELLLFVGLFFALSLGMHYEEWFDHPMQHIGALPSSPLGPLHPLIIVFGLYMLTVMGRLFVKMVRKILSRGK